MNKPRIFIGSSSEGINIAKAIELNLSKQFEITVWDEGVFQLSRSNLENLEEAITTHEFAILVFTPDDWIKSRKSSQYGPRDNVLFELGLFMGSVGRKRTFVVCDTKKVKVLSDWDGITLANYDSDRVKNPGEINAAISPACTQIIEAINIAPPLSFATSKRLTTAETIYGKDQLYQKIVSKDHSQSRVVISHTETSWAWRLFPTMLEWACGGVPVTLHLTSPQGDPKTLRQEKYRRNLLGALGFRVVKAKKLPLCGFFLDVDNENDVVALLVNENSNRYSPLATEYEGDDHGYAAKALLATVPKPKGGPKVGCGKVKVESADVRTIIGLLKKGVSQYKNSNVKLEHKKVKTEDLMLISKYTREYKYEQIKYLVRLYKSAKINLFKAGAVELLNGQKTYITPPVVEKTTEGLVVIEGNTRATYCHLNKRKTFNCILVSGVEHELPGKPWPINEVAVTSRTLSASERIEGFDYSKFRHIERSVHPY